MVYSAGKEEYAGQLIKGPAWLKLDIATGKLSGTPTAEDAGTVKVEVLFKRAYLYEK